ncbi:dynamin family protein [Lysinibacillus mangiferihumi]|uniref:dynamin family protein n=2 Tax=Lysinibacillus mangiferihumi TaxID=1130819 RepID=UPI000D38BBE5|nr:dynamin family protein [Lysinibacillus mangiferihumi]
MIQSTRLKFEQANEYVQNTLQEAELSEEVLVSTDIKASLARLNNGVFKIAVVAPFSAGKSTFINSLLGFDLLSTSILVETAAITTVKYAESPRAEINYYDGSQIIIDGDQEDLFGFKSEIKRYTAVNREDDEFEVEASISHVDVYWPIDLCKNGVEIVDTPGLFAQYEAHSGITSNILKSVNAVIFIIDPTTVGEINFMKVIREYVENAKRTTLDNSDKHIFFAVNKIDQYPELEVEKAYIELKKVLEGVVMAPKIFKVSSYFGLMTKMFEDGHITINDIRRDETIKFVDGDGFPVAGRAINESDVPTIKRISNIQAVYDSLGIYFEEKNGYLISEVFQKLNRAIELEVETLKKHLQLEEKRFKDDSGQLKEKAEKLNIHFKKEISSLKMKIEELTEYNLNDISSKKSIMSKLRQLFHVDAVDTVEEVRKEFNSEWRKSKRGITKNNADDVLDKYFNIIDLKIENVKQQYHQMSFNIIQKGIMSTIQQCEELIQELEENFKRHFETEFDIEQSNISFFNFDELIEELSQEIEKLFKGNSASEIHEDIDGSLSYIKAQNTRMERKKGVVNFFKSWFGKEERVSIFELEDFIIDLTSEVELALDSLEEELHDTLRSAHKHIGFNIDNEVIEMLNNQLIKGRIEQFGQWQSKQLTSLYSETKASEENYNELKELNEDKCRLLEQLVINNRNEFERINNLVMEELV